MKGLRLVTLTEARILGYIFAALLLFGTGALTVGVVYHG